MVVGGDGFCCRWVWMVVLLVAVAQFPNTLTETATDPELATIPEKIQQLNMPHGRCFSKSIRLAIR